MRLINAAGFFALLATGMLLYAAYRVDLWVLYLAVIVATISAVLTGMSRKGS